MVRPDVANEEARLTQCLLKSIKDAIPGATGLRVNGAMCLSFEDGSERFILLFHHQLYKPDLIGSSVTLADGAGAPGDLAKVNDLSSGCGSHLLDKESTDTKLVHSPGTAGPDTKTTGNQQNQQQNSQAEDCAVDTIKKSGYYVPISNAAEHWNEATMSIKQIQGTLLKHQYYNGTEQHVGSADTSGALQVTLPDQHSHTEEYSNIVPASRVSSPPLLYQDVQIDDESHNTSDCEACDSLPEDLGLPVFPSNELVLAQGEFGTRTNNSAAYALPYEPPAFSYPAVSERSKPPQSFPMDLETISSECPKVLSVSGAVGSRFAHENVPLDIPNDTAAPEKQTNNYCCDVNTGVFLKYPVATCNEAFISAEGGSVQETSLKSIVSHATNRYAKSENNHISAFCETQMSPSNFSDHLSILEKAALAVPLNLSCDLLSFEGTKQESHEPKSARGRPPKGFGDYLRDADGYRVNKCSICGRVFATKTGLDIHIKVHLGDKHLQCPHCIHRSYCMSNLKKHIKLRHKDYSNYSSFNLRIPGVW